MFQRYTPTQILILLAIAALFIWQMGILRGGQLWWIIGLVVGITVHEACHALTAVRLGDPTPRLMGRLSLNPLRHLDPVGSFLILVAHFGWGKPVVFNPANLRVDPAFGSALVSVAGPVANLATAFLAYQPLRAGVALDPIAHAVLVGIVSANLGLAAFNLIPIPPLDGFGFVSGLLPKPLAYQLQPLRQYGPMLLLLLVFLPALGGPDILGSILRPVIANLTKLIMLG
jgi:Zn-dependent protease